MKVCFFSFLFLIFFIPKNCFSQDTIAAPILEIIPISVEINPITTLISKPTNGKIKNGKTLTLIPTTILNHWKNKNTIGFDLNEIAFVNWNAGGTSSISGLLKGNFTKIRSDINSEWVNELTFRYGVNKQDGLTMRKSDDEFRFNSTYGYRKDTLSNWYFSAKFNFKTQFTNGYKYPDTSTPISKAFAPAYTFLGVGADYFDKEKKFDVYISPLTLKNTLVLDQELANKGAFGMDKATYDSAGNIITPGENSTTEIGFLVTNYYKKEVWKNITMENRLSLYTDYIHNFGNIDVEWKLQFDLVVNQYVRANIGTHLIYDDDVKTIEEINGVQVTSGAKVQLKQSLGVGLVYNF
jgi:hypothetical protein